MIEGRQIILRAYKEGDMEISVELINALSIRTMLGRINVFPFSMVDQKKFIEESVNSNGSTFNFAIEEKRKWKVYW